MEPATLATFSQTDEQLRTHLRCPGPRALVPFDEGRRHAERLRPRPARLGNPAAAAAVAAAVVVATSVVVATGVVVATAVVVAAAADRRGDRLGALLRERVKECSGAAHELVVVEHTAGAARRGRAQRQVRVRVLEEPAGATEHADRKARLGLMIVKASAHARQSKRAAHADAIVVMLMQTR
eukprot:3972399-Pleurochrysis_carterae.AAC.1